MREKILRICKEADASIDFTSHRLVEDGLMDSITLVEIVSSLMLELGIEIPYEEITPENFNSIDAITKLVEKYV